MSRRKKVKVAHGPSHHYAPLAMSPVVSFDKQPNQLLLGFTSPIPRPTLSAGISPASGPTRTSSSNNFLTLRSVASDSPLSSPSVSLQSAPLPSPAPAVGRPVDLHNDPYLLDDDELPDVDALIAQAHINHNTQPNHPLHLVDEVPATPTPPNLPPHPTTPHQPPTPAPPVQRSLSYLLADSSPPPPPSRPLPPPSSSTALSRGPSVVPSSVEVEEPAVAIDDYPSLSQLLNEEEEERRQVVEDEDFASLEELLNQSDDESEAVRRSTSDGPTQHSTQQSTQPTQPTQVLSSAHGRADADEDETEASDVDELAATQVLPPRLWADESQSQSQRPPDEELLQDGDGPVADVTVSVSCGVSGWQSSPAASVDGDARALRPPLLHTGRILLSNSSSMSLTPS